MRIDHDRLTIGDVTVPLYSDAAFALISDLWLKVGWNQRYAYGFEWRGRQILQHPEDLIRAQMAIWSVRPSVVIETGVAHGGSLVFWADMLRMLPNGGMPPRVIGVEQGVLPETVAALKAYQPAGMIDLIEGDSAEPETAEMVAGLIWPDDAVMVFLDSNHSREHVAAELELYARLVTPGSYIVACDGITGVVADAPRGRPEWRRDNPTAAAREFAERHPEFRLVDAPHVAGAPAAVTQWPGGWLRRLSP